MASPNRLYIFKGRMFRPSYGEGPNGQPTVVAKLPRPAILYIVAQSRREAEAALANYGLDSMKFTGRREIGNALVDHPNW